MVTNSRHRLSSCCRNLTTLPEYNNNNVTSTTTTTTTVGPETIVPSTPTNHANFSHSRRQRLFRRSQSTIHEETKTQQHLSTQHRELVNALKNITHTVNYKVTQKYGFTASDNTSVHLNARKALGNTHPSDYFSQVTKLTFHDLTDINILPKNSNQLLGLGLKFIPVPDMNITQKEMDRSDSRFERDMGLRVFFAGDEQNTSYDPKTLRGKSSWRAPLPPLEIDNRMCRFQQELNKRFVYKQSTPNLSPSQQKILRELRNNKNIVILNADKGLGPVGVTTQQYVTWGLKHILDKTTYTLLSEINALNACETLYREIFQWTCTNRKDLETDTINFIRERVEKARRDPFGYFYLLAKLHKTPVSTRPVCSDCASLPHSIGKWVDRQLQPIVRNQQTYFKNSIELKALLDTMEFLPNNASLFTYDAISMYTNIDTKQCIERLTAFLNNPATIATYPHLKPKALTEALQLVMKNNRMRFGNLYVHQHKGIAMGMAPAPSIANLFVAIYESTHINPFPTSSLRFLRRFIDDGFGIWLRDSDHQRDTQKWELFQTIVNNMGLQWEFSERTCEVTFMDLNICLSNGKLYTSLYAKPMALHLYIPPSSCHAPGIATGLIHGHFYRVFMLCSRETDIEHEIYQFFNRLLDRGYSLPQLIPIFLNAEQKARQAREARQRELLLNNPHHCTLHHEDDNLPATFGRPNGAIVAATSQRNEIFFHLRYHPANPSASDIQKLWRRHVLTPPYATPLYKLRNRDGFQVDIQKLTIAYSRAPNLGNLLSCRKLRLNIEDYTDTHTVLTCSDEEHGPPTSSATDEELEPPTTNTDT